MPSTELFLLEPAWAKPGDKWFRTAYKWRMNQIFEWMNKIATTAGSQDARILLTAIYNRLLSLSLPEGSLYKDAKLLPPSHIARFLNQDWNKDDEKTSRFIVSGMSFRQTIENFIGPMPDWWSPFDLLGLFLSLLGPAPSTANKNNFYLPLTAVYGRWCARIAGQPDRGWKKWRPEFRGEGTLPFVFQCTWHVEVDHSTKQHWGRYFLGASTAGDKWDTNPKSPTFTGSWRERVQEARFNMLFKCQKIGMVMVDDFSAKRAPNMNIANRSMVPFGNCGETYPFAMIFLKEKSKNLPSMSGLALQKRFMEKEEYGDYDEFSDSPIWKSLMAPCANCMVLIQRAGANNSQFALDLGRDEAPTRPASMADAKELSVEAGHFEQRSEDSPVYSVK
ncbi:hypothetical protein FGADI_2139 [Fusarium gaditjirri]|uniref:Uncharacterized protein n=1 Tax=Fusarium gaditjirri TaxID=282569 RepID=A0A8H4TIS8_9HYPO|nr:hypothetical protein FGADI_2139 [Fusarium gaditjirri]